MFRAFSEITGLEDPMKKANPVDSYLAAKQEKNASRDAQDHELWQTWKADPNPQTLDPLLTRFQPVFNSKVRAWKAPNTNEVALRADMATHAIRAFGTYDPTRGASLTTHVTNTIEKSKRWNARNQNLAFIPEDKSKHIGRIDSMRDELYDEYGREPTHAEISSGLGIKGLTPKRVAEIQGLRRADIRGSSFESDPLGHQSSRDAEVMSLIRPELSERAQRVYDHIYGENRVNNPSTSAIAKKLGLNASQVSRLKNEIIDVYKRFK